MFSNQELLSILAALNLYKILICKTGRDALGGDNRLAYEKLDTLCNRISSLIEASTATTAANNAAPTNIRIDLDEENSQIDDDTNNVVLAEMVYSDLKNKRAQLSLEQIDQLDDWFYESGSNRRCALLMICNDFSCLSKKVIESDLYAEGVAAICIRADGVIGGFSGALHALECSRAWMLVALAKREDMEELLDKARKEYGQ